MNEISKATVTLPLEDLQKIRDDRDFWRKKFDQVDAALEHIYNKTGDQLCKEYLRIKESENRSRLFRMFQEGKL